jgi:hypothetical protein
LDAIAAPFVPKSYLPYVNLLVQDLVQSSIPYLGILLAILIFLDTFFKGTWGSGVILIITGFLFLLYDYVLYEQGTFFTGLFPENYTSTNLTSDFQNNLNILVLVLILPTVVSIGEGIYILAKRR